MRRLSALAVLVMAVGLANPAAAHTELVSTKPVAGATVTAPISIELVFSEPPLADAVSLAVEDSKGALHDVDVTGIQGSTVQASLPKGLPAGATIINWRVTADDGHVLQGSIPVTYAPGDDVEGDGDSDSDDSTASATPSEPGATPVATMSPIALGPGQSPGDITWWITGCVLLGAGGMLIFLLSRR